MTVSSSRSGIAMRFCFSWRAVEDVHLRVGVHKKYSTAMFLTYLVEGKHCGMCGTSGPRNQMSLGPEINESFG